MIAKHSEDRNKNIIKPIIAVMVLMSTVFVTFDAEAKRIRVGPSRGTDLLEACLLAGDSRDVKTTNGSYFGCCSEELGYCILCKSDLSGVCYQFTTRRDFLQFQQSQAPTDSGVVVEEPDEPDPTGPIGPFIRKFPDTQMKAE